MSTTTTNYGLVKPELTDAADITAMNPNWDKIDQELNKKYGTDNKPTASDVGARPDTWMPTASDVGAMANDYGTVQQDDLFTWAYSLGLSGNFNLLPDKTTKNVPSAGYYIGHVIVSSTGRAIEMMNMGTFRKYYVTTSAGVFTDWKEVGDFKSDGSVPMSGTIDFAANGADFNTDSWFAIGMDNESISLLSRKNGKNRRLNLNNITSSLTDALRLWYYDDGNEHTARIFGEHNTSLLATTIQNLISGGSISMVKSVQRGIITIAANATVGTATISSVNTSKAVVLYGGSINNGSDSKSMDSSGYWDVRLILKSATQVEATRRHVANFDVYVPYHVLEFS